MTDVFNRLMGLDPSVLERERFSLQPEDAQKLLRKNGKLRARRYLPFTPYQHQPPVVIPKKKRKSKHRPKSRRPVINLSEAQQRAFDNWMERETEWNGKTTTNSRPPSDR
jgi:hypothetical protein